MKTPTTCIRADAKSRAAERRGRRRARRGLDTTATLSPAVRAIASGSAAARSSKSSWMQRFGYSASVSFHSTSTLRRSEWSIRSNSTDRDGRGAATAASRRLRKSSAIRSAVVRS